MKLNKLPFAIFLLLFACSPLLSNNSHYTEHFTNQRLRVDLIFAGDSKNQECYLEALYKEPQWGGSPNNLIDKLGYGEYNYRVEDESGKLLFSKGFNSLFQEWRTTQEANELKRAMRSSVTFPFPRERVNLIISQRSFDDGKFYDLASFPVDPNDKSISNEKSNNYSSYKIIDNGESHNKVDLVFIAEGYEQHQISKFRQDVDNLVNYLFSTEPYKTRQKDFNVWVVEAVSKQSGSDLPHKNIWVETALSSKFYTFGIDRYLTLPDQSIVASAASQVPYDALYVVTNSDIYGGGGIYNFYGLSTSDNIQAAPVFVHELGHSFAGLADEYYTSEVAYEDFYNLAVEPWEPNITTQINFDSKWKDMLLNGEAGLFEGGGYMSKGIFRPAMECRMKSNSADGFCPVCRRAIENVIDTYTK